MKLIFLTLFLTLAFAKVDESVLACKGCTTVVGVIENWMKSNKTVAYIEDNLKQFCALFNGTEIQKPCERIIDFGVPKVINSLERKFPPERICAMIGVCTNVPMKVMFSRKLESDGKEVLCDGCKILVNSIHAWVTSDSMIKAIDSLFDKMCLLFNNTDFKPVCEDIVNYGIDKVIEYVQKKLPADKVCSFVKACPAQELVQIRKPTKNIQSSHRLNSDKHFNHHKLNKKECSECLTIVHAVSTYVSNNGTSPIDFSNNFCELFINTDFYNSCKSTNFTEIIEEVQQKKNSMSICFNLKKCVRHPHHKMMNFDHKMNYGHPHPHPQSHRFHHEMIHRFSHDKLIQTPQHTHEGLPDFLKGVVEVGTLSESLKKLREDGRKKFLKDNHRKHKHLHKRN